MSDYLHNQIRIIKIMVAYTMRQLIRKAESSDPLIRPEQRGGKGYTATSEGILYIPGDDSEAYSAPDLLIKIIPEGLSLSYRDHGQIKWFQENITFENYEDMLNFIYTL